MQGRAPPSTATDLLLPLLLLRSSSKESHHVVHGDGLVVFFQHPPELLLANDQLHPHGGALVGGSRRSLPGGGWEQAVHLPHVAGRERVDFSTFREGRRQRLEDLAV